MVKVKKPKAIMFDLTSLAMKAYFNEKVLMPYFLLVGKSYLEKNWDEASTKEDIDRIRNEQPAGELPTIPPKEADKAVVVQAVVSYINYCIEKKIEPNGYLLLK